MVTVWDWKTACVLSCSRNPSRDKYSKCAVWGDQQATCVFPSSEPATLFSLSLKKYFYCDSFFSICVTGMITHEKQNGKLLETQSTGTPQWCFEVWNGFSSSLTSVLFTSQLRGQWRTHPVLASPKPPISAHIPSNNVHKLDPGQYAASLWLSYFVDCLLWVFPSASTAPVSIQQV